MDTGKYCLCGCGRPLTGRSPNAYALRSCKDRLKKRLGPGSCSTIREMERKAFPPPKPHRAPEPLFYKATWVKGTAISANT